MFLRKEIQLLKGVFFFSEKEKKEKGREKKQ
jgi:hypothetical protein